MKQGRGVWRSAILAIALTCGGTGCAKIEQFLAGLGSDEETEPKRDAAQGDVVRVATVEELIAALGPGKTIELEPGEYVFVDGHEDWLPKDAEPGSYDALSEHYEGGKISGVHDMALVGLGDGATLVMPDPYRPVVELWNSRNVRIENITAGHRASSCAEGVVKLVGVDGARLSNVRLFGSGTEGLTVIRSQNVEVGDSRIYECTRYLARLHESKDVRIENTTFEDNGSDAQYLLQSGFMLQRSNLRLEGVTLANNLGETQAPLLSIGQGDTWGIPPKEELPEGFGAPKKSSVELIGGEIRGNRFGSTGVDEHDVKFRGTKWSDNTMVAPPGVSETKPPSPLALGYVSTYSGWNSTKELRNLEVKIDGYALGTLEPEASLFLRSRCRVDDHLVVDEVEMFPRGLAGPLADATPGTAINFEGIVYDSGMDRPLRHCELAFRLGSRDDAGSVLSTWCLKKGRQRAGPCDPPLAPTPMSGAEQRLTIEDLEISTLPIEDGTIRLATSFVVALHDRAASHDVISIKAACRTEGTTWADLRSVGVFSGVGGLEPGESVARRAVLYTGYLNVPTKLPEAPKRCDLVFKRVGSPPSGELVRRVCWRDGKVSEGACVRSEGPKAPGPISAKSVTVSDVHITTTSEPQVGPDWYVTIEGAVAVHESMADVPELLADVRCTVGGKMHSDRIRLVEADLSQLDVGDTVLARGTAFNTSPLSDEPSKCSATFLLEALGTASEPVSLDKWCSSNGTTNPC